MFCIALVLKKGAGGGDMFIECAVKYIINL